MKPEESLKVAIIDDAHKTDSPQGRAIQRIITGLKEFGILVGEVASPEDARAAFSALPDIDCILINWNLGGDTPERHEVTAKLIDEIRERNEKIPIFLMGEPTNAPPTTLPLKTVREVNEYIWVMEDTCLLYTSDAADE